MAMANFSLCLVLILYQLSAVYSNEASSELLDLGLAETQIERGFDNPMQHVVRHAPGAGASDVTGFMGFRK
ncbi:unnamed protein product [Colias eurytheme]|nr:unnamed protein product [Colias eurytheme]